MENLPQCLFQLNEKCRHHAEAEERARKQQSELHTKLNSQNEIARELNERLQKSNEEEAMLQQQIDQLHALNSQERENLRRAQQRSNVNVHLFRKSDFAQQLFLPARYLIFLEFLNYNFKFIGTK